MQRLVHRPARMTRPQGEAAPREVEAPPVLPEGRVASPVQALLPMLGAGSSLVMMVMFRSPGMMGVGAALMVVTALGALLMMYSHSGQAAELVAAEEETRRAALLLNPSPGALHEVVRDPARRWERRRYHRDFLQVRVGTGDVPGFPLQVRDNGSSLQPTDPFMLAEARAVVDRFSTIPGMPLTVPLDRVGNVSVVGEQEAALAVVRALLVQAVVFHAPEDLGLALACPPERAEEWAWVKWLPHVLTPELRDGPTEARRIAPDCQQLARLLAPELRERANLAAEVRRGSALLTEAPSLQRLLVVHDTHGEIATELSLPDQAVSPAEVGVTVVHLVDDRVHEPEEVAVRITVAGSPGQLAVTVEDLRAEEPVAVAGVLDDVPVALAEGLARTLAPLRLSPESLAEDGTTAAVDFVTMLGIGDPATFDVPTAWAPRSDRDFLRVPIGADSTGAPVLLDLKESSQLGMGPHGLCVGATGSGKSELLRTLVTALIATHPPDQVSMVLVDYKGGATFAPFAAAPHVAGVITNLENDAGMVERVHASLAGEVRRRQQVLKDAGNVANVTDYAELRRRRPELEPLPHLLVITDEFGELLAAKPDFVDLFLTIGRIGRSIGVHLLLASQRLEGGHLKGLDTYLSYRLGLRTFSESESRMALDTPDAFHLPPLPGYGYLKVDTTVYQRFKAGYVSGAYQPPDEVPPDEEKSQPLPYPIYNILGPADADGDVEEVTLARKPAGQTVLEMVVERVRAAADPVRQIWLPPLPAALSLDAVAGRVSPCAHGLRLAIRPEAMVVPVGLVDDPARQWQGRWLLDLRVAGGHMVVIGGPQSGKTTFLRTLVTSLALTHTPRQVAVYGLDLAGGGLGPLAGFPHVGGVAGRADRERIRRTVEEVRGMLDHRERVFRERGIDSVETLRARHAAGELPELPTAEVVLVVDGYGMVRTDFEEIDEPLADLLQRGGGYGVHVVASVLRWHDIRIAIQSTFGTKVELRLNDPADSAIDRKLAETIRAEQRGRALTQDKLFAQVALPRVDGVADDTGLGEVIGTLADAVRASWPGEPVPRVRVLPTRLAPASLPGRAEEPHRVPLGVDGRRRAGVVAG